MTVYKTEKSHATTVQSDVPGKVCPETSGITPPIAITLPALETRYLVDLKPITE
jgi:hypothetical protein